MITRDYLIKSLSIIAISFAAFTVTFGAVLFNQPDMPATSPTLFETLLYVSFAVCTCSIVIECIVLRMRKKIYGSLVGRKENFIFLVFTVITIIFWLAHTLEFVGLLERQGYEIGSHPLWQIFAPLMLIGVFLIPFLCFTIIVLAAFSLCKYFRHKKIENRRILREITAVLVGVSIVIGLSIVLLSTGGTWGFVRQLVYRCLPPLVGGVAAGYLSRRRGWFYGLLVVGIPGVFGVLAVLFEYYWGALGAEDIHSWDSEWWLLILALIMGMAGGFLGELLIKTKLRRSKEKAL